MQLWNTLEEESVGPFPQRAARSGLTALQKPKIRPLAEVQVSELPRLDMGDQELNRVLEAGLSQEGPLLGGEPGIGKSTLMLQVALQIGQKGAKVLYISGRRVPSR